MKRAFLVFSILLGLMGCLKEKEEDRGAIFAQCKLEALNHHFYGTVPDIWDVYQEACMRARGYTLSAEEERCLDGRDPAEKEYCYRSLPQ